MKKLMPTAFVVLAAAAFLALLNYYGLAQEAKNMEDKAKAAKQAAVTSQSKYKLPPYKLVAPMDVLMDVTDTMFYELEEKIDEKKFKTVRKHALFLAEITNVTKYGYLRKDKRQKAWLDYCDKSIKDLVKMGAASKAKKEKEVKALWTSVENLCNGCHDDFEGDWKL